MSRSKETKKFPLSFKIVLGLLVFVLLQQLTFKATGGFQITHIETPSTVTPFEKHYTNAPLSLEVRQILQQRFRFLGRGSQSYAFISEDGEYVLKVFQQHNFLAPAFLKMSFFPEFMRNFAHTLEVKRERFMKSIAIAGTDWKEETGTLYVHLAPSQEIGFTLTFIDKLNIAHAVPADTLQFAVQKKADLVSTTLRSLLESGDRAGAEACVRSLIALIKKRSEKGIGDRDPVVRRNFGFIGHEAVEIDIGSYYENVYLKEEPLHGRSVFFEIKNLRGWLQKHFPELAPLAENELEPYLKQTL